jgi:hypothetical protein
VGLLADWVSQAHKDVGQYRLPQFILPPGGLCGAQFCVPTLHWSSIRYGSAEIEQVPDDRRGVYAFAISEPSVVMPPHGYVLYIGIAGRNSQRSLRERYSDYLNEKKLLKRERLAVAIHTWRDVMRFFFAPVDQTLSSADLLKLEAQLNSVLMPPYSIGDLEAEVKKKRRAFT